MDIKIAQLYIEHYPLLFVRDTSRWVLTLQI
nr:MAG TPA: hypothetical protein [Caudoviricetes sp.]